MLARMTAGAATFNQPWLKAAFIFLLVGYGTKMGLAPLHTWLPDAHSEAPSVVSALLSGALLNCAFLAILRVHTGLRGGRAWARSRRELLRLFGLFSMAVAAVFILGQTDYKRMLAYSSVEHMGILALGVGLGGAGSFGALLHAVNHSLAKAMLFLLAGNILAAYRTKATAEVRGMARVLPVTGALWIAGFLAITGSPPFGPFVSRAGDPQGRRRQRTLRRRGALPALPRPGLRRHGADHGDDGAGTAAGGVRGRRRAALGGAARRRAGRRVLALGLAPPARLIEVIREAARALGAA